MAEFPFDVSKNDHGFFFRHLCFQPDSASTWDGDSRQWQAVWHSPGQAWHTEVTYITRVNSSQLLICDLWPWRRELSETFLVINTCRFYSSSAGYSRTSSWALDYQWLLPGLKISASVPKHLEVRAARGGSGTTVSSAVRICEAWAALPHQQQGPWSG